MIRTTLLIALATTAASATAGGARFFRQDKPVGLAALDAPTARPVEASNQSQTAEAPALTTLDGSLQPLIERFNADKGKLRLVTLMSPT